MAKVKGTQQKETPRSDSTKSTEAKNIEEALKGFDKAELSNYGNKKTTGRTGLRGVDKEG